PVTLDGGAGGVNAVFANGSGKAGTEFTSLVCGRKPFLRFCRFALRRKSLTFRKQAIGLHLPFEHLADLRFESDQGGIARKVSLQCSKHCGRRGMIANAKSAVCLIEQT